MKKILALITIVLALQFQGSAQSKFALSTTSLVYLDTNVNATQTYLYSALIRTKVAATARFIGTKISGYVKGSVALQYLTDTTGLAAGTATWTTLKDSLTLANSTTNGYVWPALGFVKVFRLRVTTIDSTQSLKIAGEYLVR